MAGLDLARYKLKKNAIVVKFSLLSISLNFKNGALLMKKIIVATVLVVGLVSAGFSSASSNNSGKSNKHMGRENGQCQQLMDQATSDKMLAFKVENKDLFKLMVMKKAEQRAMMHSDSVDPVVAGKIAGELFDLRLTLAVKAQEAGVPFNMGKMGGHGKDMGQGKGPGKGQGRMNNNN